MRPSSRLPFSQNSLVPATIREFIPISQFGVAGNSWTPISTDETVQAVYMNDRLDKGSAIGLRVLWSTGSSTTTDSATFRILYTPVTIETDALPGIASTALGTAITADVASATADVLKYSPQGVIAAETITDGDALVLALNVNATSGLALDGIAAENVVVYGVEIEYVTTYLD